MIFLTANSQTNPRFTSACVIDKLLGIQIKCLQVMVICTAEISIVLCDVRVVVRLTLCGQHINVNTTNISSDTAG
jgi:hypothetical protein